MDNLAGLNNYAQVLQERMKRVDYKPPAIDFGYIMADFSLKTTFFGIQIPQGDYLVCRNACIGQKRERLTTTQIIGKTKGDGHHPHGAVPPLDQGPDPKDVEWKPLLSGDPYVSPHDHPNTEGAHIHDVIIPESMRSIKPGDRVLVVWVGNDAVVVDIILEATELHKKEWEPYA